AFTLAAGSLGSLAAAAYLLAAAALARAGSAAIERSASLVATGDTLPAQGDAPGFWATIEGILLRVGGWIGLGLLAASYIECFVPEGLPLREVGGFGRAAFVGALAVPACVCTAGAVPIAAALAGK